MPKHSSTSGARRGAAATSRRRPARACWSSPAIDLAADCGQFANRVVGDDRLEEALQRKFADRLDLDNVLDGSEHALGDERLAGLRFAAKASGKVRHGADRPVVPPAFETDGADGCIPLGDT